jgi:hypothetical protein
MSRKSQIIYFSIWVILAVVSSAITRSFAQDLHPAGPPGSTSFLPVPSKLAIPTEPSINSASGINYPQTNTGATASGNGPGIAQSIPDANGTSNLSFPPSGDQGSIITTPRSQVSGDSSPLSANPFLPTTLEPEKSVFFEEAWTWQYLPDGILYKSYLAGDREPRFAGQWIREKNAGWLWDVALGGRAGIVRYGTMNSPRPEGWQIDIEGAAFPRLNIEHERDLDAVDFRFGIPITVQRGPWQAKFGYYHLSSHMGDEYLVRNNTLDRINYVRETMIFGVGYFWNPALRFYSEAGWAFYTDGGSQPWEFQFGFDYSPIEPTRQWPSPFFAINAHLHQEVDYSGNMTVQTGMQWRGQSGRLFRIGLQYLNGMSNMAQFYNRFEEQVGMGIWYDF